MRDGDRNSRRNLKREDEMVEKQCYVGKEGRSKKQGLAIGASNASSIGCRSDVAQSFVGLGGHLLSG
jgi:hypothetical protein